MTHKKISKDKADLASNIDHYYNTNFEVFNSVFGNTIQVFQPIDEFLWLAYIRETLNIEDGYRILDVGCGNCIPAINFAEHIACHISAITISQKQFDQSKINIQNRNLIGDIDVFKGDFHNMDVLFNEKHFDLIYFLESIGHSNDKKGLLRKAHKLLKENGAIYIQDLFFDHGFSVQSKEKIKSIEEPSHYYVDEIGAFLQMCTNEKYYISSCKNLTTAFADEIEQKLTDLEKKSAMKYRNLENAYCSYVYGITLIKM